MNTRFIGKVVLVVVAVNAVAWALSFPTKDQRHMLLIAPSTTSKPNQSEQTAASAQSTQVTYNEATSSEATATSTGL